MNVKQTGFGGAGGIYKMLIRNSRNLIWYFPIVQ